MRVLLGCLIFAACGGGGGGGDDGREVVSSAGTICAFSIDPRFPTVSPGQSFQVGQPVFFQINTGICLSSSCSDDIVATCAVATSGGRLAVTSTASWIDTSQEQNACTADCVDPASICQTAELGAGDFTIEFGDARLALTVPSDTDTPPCVEN